MRRRAIELWVLVGLGITAGIGLAFAAPAEGDGQASHSTADMTSAWARGEEGAWSPSQHAYGLVSDMREMRMIAPSSLRVVECETVEGQRVAGGEVLARIQSPEIADLVERLDAQRKTASLAQRMLGDTNQRFDQKLATKQEVLRVQIDAAAAESAYTDRWNQLAQTLANLGVQRTREQIEQILDQDGTAAVIALASTVRASFAGVVMQRGAVAGLTLPAGALLFAIEDTSGVFVDVGVMPSYLDLWQTGTANARLLGDDLPLEHIDAIARLDPATGLVLVRFRADIPDDRQADGAIVKVTSVGAQVPVVWVPRQAIVARNGATWCLIDDGSGTPKPTRVTVGPAKHERIPVLSGLEAGQRVLIHNAYEVLYRDLNELVKFQD